jgi:hypothetical protein
MADKKISELTALTGANVADTDLLPIVDISETETKKITFGEFKSALDTATGFVRITGDTMTGALDVQSTITADGLTVDGLISTTASQSTDGQIRISNSTTRASGNKYGIRFADSSFETNASIYTEQGGSANNAAALIFGTNGGTGGIVLTSATERMRIDSGGNVGIGTSNATPSNGEGLCLGSGSTITRLDMRNTTTGDATGDGTSLQLNGNNFTIENREAGYVAVSTSLTERMRIDSSGNVGIGTVPTANNISKSISLVNGGSIFGYGNGTYITANSNYNGAWNTVATGPDSRMLLDGNVIFSRSAISHSGTSVAYNTSSDYRLKTDAQPMTGASDRVLALKPVNFEWISTGDRVDGFLAHEAQTVVPECVTGTKDAMRDEQYEVTAAVLDANGMVVTEAVMGTRSVPDYQGIDQSKLVPLLTAALQEALTKIADMETRLSALEG